MVPDPVVNFTVVVEKGEFRDCVELVLHAPVDSTLRAQEFGAFVKSVLERLNPGARHRHVLVVDLVRLPYTPWINPIVVASVVKHLVPLVGDITDRFDTCLYRVPTRPYKVASEIFLQLFPCRNGEVVRCFGPDEGAALQRARAHALGSREAKDLASVV